MSEDKIKFMDINPRNTQNEENIHFVDINPYETKGIEKTEVTAPKTPYIPKLQGCNTTLDEILVRCNPANFMEPYDKEKVDKANLIFSKAKGIKGSEKESSSVKALRDKAIEQLGIEFSTEDIYNELIKYCDPRLYSSEDNYDPMKVSQANEWYAKIIENSRDVKKLEKIREDAGNFIYERMIERTKRDNERKQKEEKERERIRKEEEKYERVIFTITLITVFVGPLVIYFAFGDEIRSLIGFGAPNWIIGIISYAIVLIVLFILPGSRKALKEIF